MAGVKFFTSGFSPFGLRVQIALMEKGIPFERIEVDLTNKSKEFLDANPIHKKVPAIVHDGKPLAESMVILEYLEEAWPGQAPLLPKDAYEKSRVRFWADYIANHFYPCYFALLTSKPDSPEKLAAIEQAKKVFKTVEDAIADFSPEGPFFTGDAFGYLDVVLASLCSYPIVLEKIGGFCIPGPEELPRLNKWMGVVGSHPSVKATLNDPEEAYSDVSELLMKRAAST